MVRPQQDTSNQRIMIINAFGSIVQFLMTDRISRLDHNYIITDITTILITLNYTSDFIQMISTFGTLQKVYKEKALILNKIFRSTGRTMDCSYNVSELIEKLMENTRTHARTRTRTHTHIERERERIDRLLFCPQ